MLDKSLARSFWAVDFYLLPLKVHYFIFAGALACVLPFRTVFAKQLGVSATAVGVIFMAVPFMKILTNPMFGFLLDYFKRLRLTLCVVMVCVAMSHVALVFIPPIRNTVNKNSTLSFQAKFEYNCPENGPPIITAPLPDFYKHLNNLNCDKHLEFNYYVQCNFQKTNESLRIGDKRQHYKCIYDCKKKNLSLSFKMKFKLNSINDSLNTALHLEDDNVDASRISSPTTSEIQATNFNSSNTMTQVHNRRAYTDSFDNTFILCINCPWNDYLECEADMIQSRQQNCHSKTSGKAKADKSVFVSMQFVALFVLMAISSVSFSAVIFLVDAVCYEMLDPHKEKFGAQRLWGTIGWGLGALVGGFLNQTMSDNSQDVDYGPSFYLLAALIILDLIPLSKIELTNVKYSLNICKDVGSLLCRLQFLIYILMVLGVGVLSGLIWNYQFWFMDEIGASQTLLGLSNTFECLVAEVPCFIFSGWFIRKFGHANCLNVTLLCFGLRYLCFSYMQNPWWSLPAGLLHGPTFGLFYASMTMYGKAEAHEGTEASVQAFLSLAFEGIGVGFGSMLGGIGVDALGSRQTFIYASITSFILLLINMTLQVLVWKYQKSFKMNKTNDQKISSPEKKKEKY